MVHDVILQHRLLSVFRVPCAARGARTSFVCLSVCLSSLVSALVRRSGTGAAPRPCHGRRAYALNSTLSVHSRFPPYHASSGARSSLAARGSNRFFFIFFFVFFFILSLSLSLGLSFFPPIPDFVTLPRASRFICSFFFFAH